MLAVGCESLYINYNHQQVKKKMSAVYFVVFKSGSLS